MQHIAMVINQINQSQEAEKMTSSLYPIFPFTGEAHIMQPNTHVQHPRKSLLNLVSETDLQYHIMIMK